VVAYGCEAEVHRNAGHRYVDWASNDQKIADPDGNGLLGGDVPTLEILAAVSIL